jgi:putative sterol carrier protein
MSGLADRVPGLSPAELRTFFGDSDAVDLTALIHEATDAELEGLVAADEVREAAVRALLERFAEFADPGRLAGIAGVVCFDLVRSGGPNECHTLRFSGGLVAVVPGETISDVTIGAGILDFVRMVTGQRNAALLYLADDLRIDGDEMLALAVGTVFRVPGTATVAVDPSALDPVDVATAVARTSGKHLREVMAGGIRDVVLGEVFRRFPEFLVPEKARQVQLSVAFRIGGRRDGEVDRYVVHVDRGECRVETDPAEGSRRDATISVGGVDFLKLVTGRLNPVKGVLTGALKVKGDRAKALALNAVMDPPRPRPRAGSAQ